MATEQELLDEIKTWDGVNPYLANAAKDALRKLRMAKPVVKPTKPEPVKEEKLTRAELLKMNKSEQVALLKKLGAKEIPALESGRVELILKLI